MKRMRNAKESVAMTRMFHEGARHCAVGN
jgi:hypothetical protein